MNMIPQSFRRAHFREERFKTYIRPVIETVIRTRGSCRILDMGGDADYWQFDMPASGVEIWLLNIEAKEQSPDPRFHVIQGDARNVAQFEDLSFDFVHSNSLIEHVGRWDDMKRVAAEIRRLAPSYYVQTPNFWFPLDPHSNAPILHWLPQPVQRRMVSSKARGFYAKATSLDHAMQIVEGTSMLDRAQLTELFPDARVLTENVLFLAKSLIALKASDS
ncbi:methyltransferase domain-containing protein [Bosea sp. LjRoot9]|uniref:methyltransferase domain-containing protein n=1 Tax=Bosea sp. LjRoot9 TaxID=3342341 RepID=UPI003ECF8A51